MLSKDHKVAQKIFNLELKYFKSSSNWQPLVVKERKFLTSTALGSQVHFYAIFKEMRISCTAVTVCLETVFRHSVQSSPLLPLNSSQQQPQGDYVAGTLLTQLGACNSTHKPSDFFFPVVSIIYKYEQSRIWHFSL